MSYTDTGSSIYLKPPPTLCLLFNLFNNLSPDSVNKNPENMINCKYYNIDDIQKIKTKLDPLSFSLFHLNICSLEDFIRF